MIRSRRATAAVLVAALLSVVAPAATFASDTAFGAVSVATSPPLNVNLLQNGDFEQAASPIAAWTTVGDVHVEKFGTKPWPNQAYGTKWGGGKQYLTCGTQSGLVRQTVDVSGWTFGPPLTVRLRADFGGTIGHKIHVAIRITGPGGSVRIKEATKIMDITNHYKRIVTTVGVPAGAQQIEATIELMPKDGAAKCKMVADTSEMFFFNS